MEVKIYTPAERGPSNHWNGGQASPRTSLDLAAKKKSLSLLFVIDQNDL